MRKRNRGLYLGAACALAAIVLLGSARLLANATDGRFVAVASGIQDQVTGLVWQEPDDGNLYAWTDAQAHCASPWRLPTLNELYTLVDIRSATSPLIDSAFTNAKGTYWSATPLAGSSSDAWFLDFTQGRVGNTPNSNTNRVRCVR
jgi:hypothetical protein